MNQKLKLPHPSSLGATAPGDVTARWAERGHCYRSPERQCVCVSARSDRESRPQLVLIAAAVTGGQEPQSQPEAPATLLAECPAPGRGVREAASAAARSATRAPREAPPCRPSTLAT